jgi:hypothetical protein
MPADKLILISSSVRRKFLDFARKHGDKFGGYGHVVDLRRSEYQLPVRLYCDGLQRPLFHEVHKLEFIGVARLGYSEAAKAVCTICGDPKGVRIFRVDWAVDLWNVDAWQLGSSCRVAGAQNCAVERSRGSVTFYPQKSGQRTILIYDKWKERRHRRDPLAKRVKQSDKVCRFEIQLRGAGVPVREFSQMERYEDLDLMDGVTFLEPVAISADQPPMRRLAALQLGHLIRRDGVQVTAKRFSAAQWSYLETKLLAQVADDEIVDVARLLRKSTREWLDSIIRFPRY